MESFVSLAVSLSPSRATRVLMHHGLSHRDVVHDHAGTALDARATVISPSTSPQASARILYDGFIAPFNPSRALHPSLARIIHRSKPHPPPARGVGARCSSRVPVPRDDARARRHTKIRTLACTAAEAFAAIDANMVVGRVERVEVTPRRGRRVRLSDHMDLAKREGGDVSY